MAILAVAAMLSACQGETSQPPPVETAEATDQDPNAKLCAAVAGATANGEESMRALFVSTPEGRDYGGGVIAELLKQDAYRFLGTEMVGGTCYAYAEARGQQWGKTFNLEWRCPVKILGDSPKESGKTLVEVVDDKQCDLDAARGAPVRQPVDVELVHL